MPAEITVRPFAPADASAVVALVVAIQRDEFHVPVTAAEQPDLADLAGFFGRGASGFWVAVEQTAEHLPGGATVGADGHAAVGSVVGCVGLLDCGGGVAALRKMFVRADRRGPPHALGRRLLDTATAHARAGGIAEIYLGTLERLYAARRFYAKAGYAPVAADALPPAFPRMAVDTHFYRCRL